jgi:DNA-binding MarR family transcriptional regulator
MDEAGTAREIAVLLVQTAEQLKADFADSIAPFELSVPAARALLLLDEPAPMRVLSDRLACDQSYITRIADELEGRGYIQRTPGTDRRVQMLSLTDDGSRARDSLYTAVTADNRVLLNLNRAERKALERALKQLRPD